MQVSPSRTVLGLGLTILTVCFAAPSRAAVQTPAPATAPKSAFQAEYDTLLKEFKAAQQAFYAKFEDLTTDEERNALFADKTQNPNVTFSPRFRSLAERAGTSETAGSAWMFLLDIMEDKTEGASIVNRLMKDFLHTPAAERLAGWLQFGEWRIGREAAIKNLRALDGSRFLDARAAASFSLASILMSGNATEQKEARALFNRVKGEFAATLYAARADGSLFELDHLQIGMVAPEIEGTDSAGAAFKLSDYRGQVIVLDYWGFW